ncbi:MAG TPA: bifunctional transaldolase/phosoglucose isomerase [Candidatus Methylomirabilis sp.]|nr:bifunctional transaldolase/phosoglucose isomerase [Candidatus Methylomirabilis sp.]
MGSMDRQAGGASGLGRYTREIEAVLGDLAGRKATGRIWEKDAALWKADPAHQQIIRNSLGWLTVTSMIREHAAGLAKFAVEVGRAGFRHVLLLGMGGSSLCPDVLRLTFGEAAGFPSLAVLDSTDPATVQAFEQSVDLPRTLFIVASKSGTTPEIAAFYQYFFEKVRRLRGEGAGEQFVAITDGGTVLQRTGTERKFRHVFVNPSDIGGRYSALSFFGMVPATLIGLDALRLLDRAEGMARACASGVPPAENPGAWLGAVLGCLARAGRDKVTFICSPEIAAFGYWVEQLIAESTGKEGTGIIPVEGETLGDPAGYGNDRVFVYLKLQDSTQRDLDGKVAILERAGQPVLRIPLQDRYDLGAEFFRWEFATAVAGLVLGVDPFDQPNVQESKDNTHRLLGEFKAKGRLPEGNPIFAEGPIRLYGDEASAAAVCGARSLDEALKAHLARIKAGDYAALTAYLQATPPHAETLSAIRHRIRDRFKVATTLGYGPRFLHSTGQLHKGGGDNGVFLQFTADDPVDLPIPGEPHTFGVMKAAQALGDLQSLQSRKRRALRVHIAGDIAAGLRRVQEAVAQAL